MAVEPYDDAAEKTPEESVEEPRAEDEQAVAESSEDEAGGGENTSSDDESSGNESVEGDDESDLNPEEQVLADARKEKLKQRKRLRLRKRIAVTLASMLLLTIITCGKILVRTELRNPQRLAKLEAERRAKLAPGEAEFSDLEYEMMGFVAASLPVVPPESPSAAERYRDFEKVTRIVAKRPENKILTAAELKAERERIARIIPRQPFVVYVGVLASIHFLIGFVCAMHLGFRPRLFGVRWSLRELDPFVKDDLLLGEQEASAEDTSDEAASEATAEATS